MLDSRKAKRELDQLSLRKNHPKAELSKELELSVLHQESVMNGFLATVDELQLSVSSFVEEINNSDNKRLIHAGEQIFNNFSKLRGLEEAYSKLNNLLYAIALSNHKRGETILELVPRLKQAEQRATEFEMKIYPERFLNKRGEDDTYIIESQTGKPKKDDKTNFDPTGSERGPQISNFSKAGK